ncbi:MAG: hypothetical protein KC468_04135, partial [Myxococcales bacterium]|nr:hypothetical protein [Myxococcales bacterium]
MQVSAWATSTLAPARSAERVRASATVIAEGDPRADGEQRRRERRPEQRAREPVQERGPPIVGPGGDPRAYILLTAFA